MRKVSVIMASYLGDYPGRSSDPEGKFLRAVKSFLVQTYENKELVIVADGCDATERLYEEHFKDFDSIKFVKIPKQPIYGGETRNAGIAVASGDVITYLDNDDVIGKNHLEIIMDQFGDDADLVYYDDYLVMSPDFKKLHKRLNETRYGSIGTSSITHKKVDFLKWQTGYGHDWTFVMTAIVRGMQFKKLEKTPQYLSPIGAGETREGTFNSLGMKVMSRSEDGRTYLLKMTKFEHDVVAYVNRTDLSFRENYEVLTNEAECLMVQLKDRSVEDGIGFLNHCFANEVIRTMVRKNIKELKSGKNT